MKKRTWFTLLATGLLVLTVCVGPGLAAILNVPTTTYPTIQAAITVAVAGDIVSVGKGVYYGQVIIDKAITVKGVCAGNTIIDGQSATNLNGVGQVRITAAGDVCFSGFTIKRAGVDLNQISPNSNLPVRVSIYASSSTVDATYTISDNIIIGSNNPVDEEDYGFYSNGGKETLRFTENTITKTGSNAILLERHEGATVVSHNTFDRGVGDGSVDAYFNMNYGGTDITTLQKVSHNNINMGTNAPGKPFDSAHRGTGITFAAGFNANAGGFTNVLVDSNNLVNLRANRRGIGTWNDAAPPSGGNIAAVIQHNTVSGFGKDVTGSMGIDTIGYIEQTVILDNELRCLDTGIRLRVWNAQNASFLEISDNQIQAFLGIDLEEQASNNYIDHNNICASGLWTVMLQAVTSDNVVTKNYLKAGKKKGDATVSDPGAGNMVAGNN